jgi:hypothetical protein
MRCFLLHFHFEHAAVSMKKTYFRFLAVQQNLSEIIFMMGNAQLMLGALLFFQFPLISVTITTGKYPVRQESWNTQKAGTTECQND